MDVFKASLVKTDQGATTQRIKIDKLFHMSEDVAILQGCYSAQADAIDELYHTSKVNMTSIKVTQIAEKTTLVPFMIKYPSNTHQMSVGMKVGLIKETVDQMVCLIEHFASEATVTEQSLELISEVTKSTSNMNCDFPNFDLTPFSLTQDLLEPFDACTNVSLSDKDKSHETPESRPLTPPASPSDSKPVKKQVTDSSNDVSKRSLPGSSSSARGRRAKV